VGGPCHLRRFSETADDLDCVVATDFLPAIRASAAYVTGTTCPKSTLDPYDEPNVAYNELKLGGQALTSQPNRLTAGHKLADTALLGHVAPADSTEDRFNAILLTRVPIASACRLATAIDDFDGSTADSNRVRRLEGALIDDAMVFPPLVSRRQNRKRSHQRGGALRPDTTPMRARSCALKPGVVARSATSRAAPASDQPDGDAEHIALLAHRPQRVFLCRH